MEEITWGKNNGRRRFDILFSGRKQGQIEDGEWLISQQFFKEHLKAIRWKPSYDSRQ